MRTHKQRLRFLISKIIRAFCASSILFAQSFIWLKCVLPNIIDPDDKISSNIAIDIAAPDVGSVPVPISSIITNVWGVAFLIINDKILLWF